MVVGDQFILACPPFCGGNRFMDHCADIGVELICRGSLFDPPDNEDRDRLYLSFVRHPYTWLKEFFINAQLGVGSLFEPELTALAVKHNSLAGFIRYCASKENVVYSIFVKYRADSVLRLEDYPWNIAEVFESLDIPETTIKTLPLKESAGISNAVFVKDEQVLRKLVVNSERAFCSAYNYLA